MGALIEVILPVFLLIGAGYVSVWRGYFGPVAVDALMRFAQKAALPCLLFRAISQLDLSQDFNLALLASYYIGAVLIFCAGLLGARFLFERSLEDSVAIGFVALFSNALLLGLPISERAFGPEHLWANYTIIAVHAPVCYLIGITTMEVIRTRGRSGVQMIRRVLTAMFSNALIIGIALGFVVNLSGLTPPDMVSEALDMMARAGLPAALFGLGGVLFQYRPEGDLRIIAYTVALSLIVQPILVFGLGHVFALEADALRPAVITAAMAPGVNAYLFADMYGRARRVAASTVLISTALCLLTAWIWLLILG
ncbi:MAG: AEC family transporter [Qingshengfaniella sp.]